MCIHLMFQSMRLGEQLQTPRAQPPRGGLTQSCPILGLYLSSQGPWEVVEGIFIQDFTLICEFAALLACISTLLTKGLTLCSFWQRFRYVNQCFFQRMTECCVFSLSSRHCFKTRKAFTKPLPFGLPARSEERDLRLPNFLQLSHPIR